MTYDLIVIGGGPAGLFAAGIAAQNGARVLLLERNRRCGAKLLITGKGRCNLTNSEADPSRFVSHFGRQGKALLTALYAFGVEETIAFFEAQGLKLQTERGGRVFPAAGDAAGVQQLLLRFVRQADLRHVGQGHEILLLGEEVVGHPPVALPAVGGAMLRGAGDHVPVSAVRAHATAGDVVDGHPIALAERRGRDRGWLRTPR